MVTTRKGYLTLELKDLSDELQDLEELTNSFP